MLFRSLDGSRLGIEGPLQRAADIRCPVLGLFGGADEAIPVEYFAREDLPWEAAFLAAQTFLEYRRAGGARRAPLPDFYIGAHAAIAGYTLLTRDARRYRTYFPKLQIISPTGF